VVSLVASGAADWTGTADWTVAADWTAVAVVPHVKRVAETNDCTVVEHNLIMRAFWTVIQDEPRPIPGD
jgi:hypothetical protein